MKNKHHHVCPWWIGYIIDTPLRHLMTPVSKVLKPYLKKGMTFVDLGCGMGFFSIQGAKIVGNSGKVIAVDIQPKMLQVLEKRAEKAGVNHIIQTHFAEPTDIRLEAKADFALAMWMLHEVPDIKRFLEQVKSVLNPGSYFLVVEPIPHVSNKMIKEEIDLAKQSGFEFIGYKDAGLFSKGMLFKVH
ncbi:MAG: hypothetical protein A2Y25_06190 [Candidatus Melainabacteria bacterium GWF2_37_15]|nr:MAG: hypothetical protein A2Y25_06190 [Candidatus Melainabacteria bacterium GWF2_37_15]